MKKLTILGIIVAGIVLLAGSLLLIVRMGPTAPGPAVDPVAKWNSERLQLAANAESFYVDAAELIGADAPEEWNSPVEPQIVELFDVADWVDSHEKTVELIREGVACGRCQFEVAWDGAFLDWESPIASFRTIAAFLAHRARLAALRGDLDKAADSLLLADAVARHASEQPTIIANLIGTASFSLLYDEVVRPFKYAAANPEALIAYSRRLAPLDRPHPPYRYAVESERDITCWGLKTLVAGQGMKRLILPDQRLFGEVERSLSPMIRLADLPLQNRLDRAHPLHVELNAIANEKPSFFNPPRALASILTANLERPMELNARAQVLQRGVRCVRAIFEHAGPARSFPDSLDFTGGADFAIDLFTGKPFIYRKTDSGFTLYSTGIDKDDDGGVHDPRFGEGDVPMPFGGDYVFWPLPG